MSNSLGEGWKIGILFGPTWRAPRTFSNFARTLISRSGTSSLPSPTSPPPRDKNLSEGYAVSSQSLSGREKWRECKFFAPQTNFLFLVLHICIYAIKNASWARHVCPPVCRMFNITHRTDLTKFGGLPMILKLRISSFTSKYSHSFCL